MGAFNLLTRKGSLMQYEEWVEEAPDMLEQISLDPSPVREYHLLSQSCIFDPSKASIDLKRREKKVANTLLCWGFRLSVAR